MKGHIVSVSSKPTRHTGDTYVIKSKEVDGELMKSAHNVDRQQLKDFVITKFVQPIITVIPGGVVDDHHFVKELLPSRECEIVMLSQEILKKHSTDFKTVISPGQLGENILTSGIDLDNLPKGAILHIGEAVKLQVVARRSFCFKFINAIGIENIQPKQRFNMNNVGIQACVLNPGTISPNDPIWVEIPDSAEPLPKRYESISLERFRRIPLTAIR